MYSCRIPALNPVYGGYKIWINIWNQCQFLAIYGHLYLTNVPPSKQAFALYNEASVSVAISII